MSKFDSIRRALLGLGCALCLAAPAMAQTATAKGTASIEVISMDRLIAVTAPDVMPTPEVPVGVEARVTDHKVVTTRYDHDVLVMVTY